MGAYEEFYRHWYANRLWTPINPAADYSCEVCCERTNEYVRYRCGVCGVMAHAGCLLPKQDGFFCCRECNPEGD